MLNTALPPSGEVPRHGAVVRVTHWVMVIAFFALLVSGVEILISHPRFYWGEVGNSLTPALFQIPIPSSRDTVDTGYDYVLPDQNGWSRYLHFEAAWAVVLAGLIYVLVSGWNGHFRRELWPTREQRNWRALREVMAQHLRFARPAEAEAHSYNALQRATYVMVIFVLFPLVIVTGLAMSPAFNSAVPVVVNALGGRQSARTIHFFVFVALVAFLLAHVVMIVLAGFRSRMQAMITGRVQSPKSRAERE